MTKTIISLPLAAIAAELRSIAQENWQGTENWMESERGILDDPRVRKLGEEANDLDGMRAMQLVVGAAFLDDGGLARNSCASAALSELNYAWAGIGDWQA